MKPKRFRLVMFLTGVTGCVLVLVYLMIGLQPKPIPASELKPAPMVRDATVKESQSKPIKVEEIIKGLALDEAKASYCDEPPGKLRALRWYRVKLNGTEAEVDVQIDIVYTLDLFSDKFEWDIKAVRAATVTKVTILPFDLNK